MKRCDFFNLFIGNRLIVGTLTVFPKFNKINNATN